MKYSRNIDYKAIEIFAKELFVVTGMPVSDAGWFATTIANANLRGIDSHGILRIPEYFDRLMCKAINPLPNLVTKQLSPAITVIEADGAAGCISGRKAMKTAMENAKKCGIGMAGVVNSNHFGAAAQYSQLAVAEDMIGISMTNVPTLIAAPGGKTKLVGNNPFAIGIPTYNEYPFMLDMSLSVVAEGKLRIAAANGSKIPNSWAVDKEGKPTEDPEDALKGFLLPVGGFKGLGMAYVVDIISGLITGGLFADKIKSMYRNPTEPSETSHMMVAINLPLFLNKAQMKEKMAYYHEYIASAPMMDGVPPLCFPGEIEQNCEKRRRSEGIPVPETVLEKLIELKKTYHLESKI